MNLLALPLILSGLSASVPSWFPRGFRTGGPSDAPALQSYLRTEDLAISDSIHRMGTVRSAGMEIVVHAWTPASARGTVFLVHGYYNHSGTWSAHIRRLLTEGWAVVALDLPGHGLSDGRRFDVDSIEEYGHALAAVEQGVKSFAPLPWSVVGHSLGGAVALERALEPGFPYRNVVLLAPMLRYTGWTWIGLALPGISLVRDYMPRDRNLTSSGDSAFLRRLGTDPLEGWQTSMHWLKAVRTWNGKVAHARLPSAHWFFLQGDADRTVDGEYGMRWFRGAAASGRVRIFPGARHHLHNEVDSIAGLVKENMDSAVAGGLPLSAK